MNLSQSLPTQMSSSEPNLSQSNMMEQQLDNLADAMTDMCVEEENNVLSSHPFSQASKRSDPVYLASAPNIQQQMLQQQYQEQQQQMLQQHYQEQQQLQQQQLMEHQHQQQYLMQQQQLQWQLQMQQEQQLQQHSPPQQTVPQPTFFDDTFKCTIGRGRILKRADLIPMQDCTI